MSTADTAADGGQDVSSVPWFEGGIECMMNGGLTT
jgi:hypothetical protein